MKLHEIYEAAAAILVDGKDDYSCHAINRAADDGGDDGKAAHRLYVDLFSPTTVEDQGDFWLREDALLIAFSNAGDGSCARERDLRVTALLFMAEISK